MTHTLGFLLYNLLFHTLINEMHMQKNGQYLHLIIIEINMLFVTQTFSLVQEHVHKVSNSYFKFDYLIFYGIANMAYFFLFHIHHQLQTS